MQSSTIPARLLQALLSIHHSTPRLIASPSPALASGAGASRRASVAIIIRLRPATPSSTSTTLSSTTNSPDSNASAGFNPTRTPLAASPSASPPTSPSERSLPVLPSTVTEPEGEGTDNSVQEGLKAFFEQPWVNNPGTTAEVLFIKRASRDTDKWSGHVAFPGGRQEPEDEDGRYTAMRETWEEVGLDLAEKEWLAVGQLDDREITTSLGKRLLMILSPFVFLHTSPHTPVPELQESEVASAHWIPLELLHAPQARYGSVGIDISTRLAPRSPVLRFALQLLVGSMHFRCILLPNDPIAIGQITPDLPNGTRPELKLWGLSLGMTLDLLSSMSVRGASATAKETKGKGKGGKPYSPPDLSTYPNAVALDGVAKAGGSTMSPLAPSMSSIFPRFVRPSALSSSSTSPLTQCSLSFCGSQTYPDINALIWVFGWRYRRLLSKSTQERATVDPRVDFAGMSLGAYYSAVRRALVVAVVLRALATIGGLGWLGWKGWMKLKERRGLVKA